ncbi:NAD(P)-binding protein [Amniculicola lignicola CBS 123094]|uniref:NAD(P)-binding protein n=1 Tax=Amniculicola lignicola CBS 123094 TaxID=1392246 RepID=A0A6A5W5G3_9PLEO|nr:NAD(P)-binding protein [Amniculicola lignicola CBS 123094]
MSPQKQTVLLTGATGNVGAVTLEHILNSTPHNVNLILRDASRAIPHFKSTYPEADASGRLIYTSIPDMTVPNVFDSAVAGVETIIHIATPISFDPKTFQSEMIDPTWVVDKSLLEAAKKSKSVRRIILCGSIVCTVNTLTELFNPDTLVTAERWNNQTLEESLEGWLPAYAYAKTNGERRTWAWMEENKDVDFDVVALLPPAITGRSPQMGYTPKADHPGGIGQVYSALIGTKTADEVMPCWLDVDDVARTHVLSIDRQRVPGNERYFTAVKEPLDLRAVAKELREKYPETRKLIPEFEETATVDLGAKFVKWDGEKADKVFGPWKSQVESIKEIVFDVLRFEEKNGGV